MKKVFGPYTPIRQAGNTYFVSGQVGIDSHTGIASEDVSEQTEQALANLSSILTANKLEMRDVVKVTIFLYDIQDFDAMNRVYETYFEAPRPARSCVAVKSLPNICKQKLRVEIEAVAYKEPVV